MYWFVLAVLFGVAGLFGVLKRRVVTRAASEGDGYRDAKPAKHFTTWPWGLGLLLLAGVFLVLSTTWKLDQGEAAVLRTYGQVSDPIIDPGLHFKKPWSKPIKFDVKYNTIDMYGSCDPDERAEDAEDCVITANTSDNASAFIDITVGYSIVPDKVKDVYKTYRSQDALNSRELLPGIRSAARDAPTKYPTATIRQQRAALTAAITEDLETRLKGTGVLIVQVDLRGIGLPAQVEEQLNKIQAARAEVETERQNVEKSKLSAERTKIDAKAQSDADQIQRCGATSTTETQTINGQETEVTVVTPVANDECQNRLNEQVLASKYIDALRELGTSGNLVVVPQGVGNVYNLTARP